MKIWVFLIGVAMSGCLACTVGVDSEQAQYDRRRVQHSEDAEYCRTQGGVPVWDSWHYSMIRCDFPPTTANTK